MKHAENPLRVALDYDASQRLESFVRTHARSLSQWSTGPQMMIDAISKAAQQHFPDRNWRESYFTAADLDALAQQGIGLTMPSDKACREHLRRITYGEQTKKKRRWKLW
jgi:hypothetical protein